MQAIVLRYLKLLNLAENLKKEMRHSWLSNGRQESVAEHSWRMALMVMLLAPHLETKINLEKALKMAIIHDLAEAEAGDVPTFETGERQEQKHARELAAMENIRKLMNDDLGESLFTLWQEYEAKQSPEARFVNAIDKLEVLIQHNEANLSTWNEWEIDFNQRGANHLCQFEPILANLSEQVRLEACQKIQAEINSPATID